MKKQNKGKRGQMKIQQMAFMLIAVTLFFALVGLFIANVLFSGLKESAAVLEERNAILLVSKLANSPELSCGEAFGTTKVNCIDFDKVMALEKNIKKCSDADFWGVSGIEIVKIYPSTGGSKLCTVENYPDCNKIEILKPQGGTGVPNFVALCRKQAKSDEVYDEEGNFVAAYPYIADVCEIAKIIVTYKKIK